MGVVVDDEDVEALRRAIDGCGEAGRTCPDDEEVAARVGRAGVRPDRHGDLGDGGLDQDPSVVEDGNRQARICAGQVEQPLALRRAGFVERGRNRASLEHVVELVGLRRPSLAHDLDSREASVSPARPKVEQLANAAEERLIRFGRRCNDEPVELAKDGCSDQVAPCLGITAPGLRPADEQPPAGTRRRCERVGEDLRARRV